MPSIRPFNQGRTGPGQPTGPGSKGVDRAGHYRVGGDRAEQLRRCPQQRDIGQPVPAEGKCHGKVDKHLGWIVRANGLRHAINAIDSSRFNPVARTVLSSSTEPACDTVARLAA